MTPGRLRNAMTVDVEDYFQVSALAPYIPRDHWDRIDCRIERNIDRVLALFDEARIKATFFTLGWIAQRHPGVVRAIVAQGHELASHGYGHERASDLSPAAFSADIERAKVLLEDIGGVEVLGYRAPSFSIGPRNTWAYASLARAGYRYSSSVYPVRHDHYGWPDAPRFAHRQTAGVLEIPPSTVRVAGRNLPGSGGGFFRLLPYPVSRRMLRQINEADGAAAIFYFHPWEIDPQQPRVGGLDARTRFRHYVNLHRTEPRLRRLLADFDWGRMDEVFPAAIGPATAPAAAAHWACAA